MVVDDPQWSLSLRLELITGSRKNPRHYQQYLQIVFWHQREPMSRVSNNGKRNWQECIWRQNMLPIRVTLEWNWQFDICWSWQGGSQSNWCCQQIGEDLEIEVSNVAGRLNDDEDMQKARCWVYWYAAWVVRAGTCCTAPVALNDVVVKQSGCVWGLNVWNWHLLDNFGCTQRRRNCNADWVLQWMSLQVCQYPVLVFAILWGTLWDPLTKSYI